MPEVFLSGIVPNVLRYALKSCDCFMMATTAQMVKMEQTETIQRTEQIVKIVQMEKMLRRRMEKMDASFRCVACVIVDPSHSAFTLPQDEQG